jgi:Ca2+-binding EF-hand superfamily protein
LAATIEAEKYLTDEKLMAIFNTFDVNKTGFITAKNIKDAFSKFGKKITDKDIQTIMDQHDADGGKSIDFEEFKSMMMGK